MTTTISIYRDGVWAGDGRIVDGCIVDCAAQLGPDVEASEDTYEAIEDAITDEPQDDDRHEGRGTVERPDGVYTWVVDDRLDLADGVYYLYPEGSSWIGCMVERGRVVGTWLQQDAETHAAARDKWAGLVPSEDDELLDDCEEEAGRELISRVLGKRCHAEMVAVSRAAEIEEVRE